MPEVPKLGLPEGEKDAGQRVDFKPTKFDLLIETKGYLLAWTRACRCPCRPVVEQTEQTDPNCPLCDGKGVFYFGGNQAQDLSGYNFDAIQQKIIDDNSPMIIRGIITSIQNQYDPWDRLGNWQSGSLMCTVRPENKLAIYDRLVVLDSEIVYSEVVEADGTNLVPSRYLVTGVNQVRGHTPADATDPNDNGELVEYLAETDYFLNDSGQIEWHTGKAPVTGTRLALHYSCHPTFLVWEHPHVVRTTLKKFKTDPATLKTPLGDPKHLPVQAMVRYEFFKS